MALANASTPGFAYFRGRVACSCLRAWLPVFEAELKRVGIIKSSIDIAQLTGGASASGGTHSWGGAADIWQHDERTILIARHMGAAAWARTRAQGFDPHCHLVLNGCPHNGPAVYQVTALKANRNGLGAGGFGGRDDGPRPKNLPILRSYAAGIKWAKKRQKVDPVTYSVYVSTVPGDFSSRPVVVRSGPGTSYKATGTKKHGDVFAASGKTKMRSGGIWRQGVNGGWLPDRRLKIRK